MVTLLRVTYKFYTLILYSILLYITVQLIAYNYNWLHGALAKCDVTRPCHFSITVSC